MPGTSCFPCLEFPFCPSGFSSPVPLGLGRIVGSGRIGSPDSDGDRAGRAVRAQGAYRWDCASSPLGPCRQSSPHGMEVCLLPSRDLTDSRGEDPGRRVECGQAARGHPGVKLSVPQLHGEQGAAGRQVWGRRGPGGSGPGLPPSHLFCSTSGLLLLPPGLPGGWGAETYYPHTPALCVSYRVNSPL